MRNKAKGFPNRISLNGEPRAQQQFASKRPDGKTRDNPGERMFRSNESRKND